MSYQHAPIEPRLDGSLADIVQICRPAKIAEFGSWQGRSAIGFIMLGRNTGIDIDVTCIDTWLGSREHWMDTAPDSEWSRDNLMVVDGEPQVIEAFRAAVTAHGVSDQITIVRATTEIASEYLHSNGETFSVVYVDADHSYLAVKNDLGYAQKILRANGIIAGDDWHWSPVRRAVIGFANRTGLRPWVAPNGVAYVLLGAASQGRRAQFSSHGWQEVSRFTGYLALLGFSLRRTRRRLVRVLDGIYIAIGAKNLKNRLRAVVNRHGPI